MATEGINGYRLSQVNKTVQLPKAAKFFSLFLFGNKSYAYVDLFKRADGGKAFLKIVRHFDHSQELRDLLHQVVDQPPHSVQGIWDVEDLLLDFEHQGKKVQQATRLSEVHQLHSKHFFLEEMGPEIVGLVAALVACTQPAT